MLDGDVNAIELPASCQISFLQDLFMQLEVKVNEKNDAVVFDASKISVITTPILQLMISLEKKLQEYNRKLVVVNPSEQFIQCLNKLGLANLITQWSDK